MTAEEALERTRRELDTVVGGAPVIVWALDPVGTITLARGAGLTAVGQTSEELVGRRLHELGSGTTRLLGKFERALRGERLFIDVELAGRVLATVVEPLRDEAGAISGLIGVSTDVTSERRLEDRAAREQGHGNGPSSSWRSRGLTRDWGSMPRPARLRPARGPS